MEKQGLSESNLTEAQKVRLVDAEYSLAIAASRTGENRLSVQFLKSASALGRMPSLLMLQVIICHVFSRFSQPVIFEV